MTLAGRPGERRRLLPGASGHSRLCGGRLQHRTCLAGQVLPPSGPAVSQPSVCQPSSGYPTAPGQTFQVYYASDSPARVAAIFTFGIAVASYTS